MGDPTVTPLRCKTFGHDYDYIQTETGMEKACTRCGVLWDDEVG